MIKNKVMPTYDEEKMDAFELNIGQMGFHKCGAGSFRRVFKRGNVVIKIPKSNSGLIDNLFEAYAWKTLRNKPSEIGVVCAPCRILSNGCLMMVVVEDYDITDDNGAYKVPRPAWVEELDQEQAGLYKGQWVAYDYALDLVERHEWEDAYEAHESFFKEEWAPERKHVHDPNADEIEEDEDGNCTCAECRHSRIANDNNNNPPAPL